MLLEKSYCISELISHSSTFSRWQRLRGEIRGASSIRSYTNVVIGPECLLVFLALVKLVKSLPLVTIPQAIRASQSSNRAAQFWSAACRPACRGGVGCRTVVDHATAHCIVIRKPSRHAVAPTQQPQQDSYHVRPSNRTTFLSLGNS